MRCWASFSRPPPAPPSIATEAGIAYGLVYHYFKNKEEILNTIFEERWERVTERLEEAEKAGANTRERLCGIAEVFIEAYRARPQVVEVLLLEFTRMSKFLEPVQLEQIGRAFTVVRRVLEQGQADGEVRREFPSAILMLLFVGGLQMILQSQVLGVFHPPESFELRGREMVVDAFFNGVRRT